MHTKSRHEGNYSVNPVARRASGLRSVQEHHRPYRAHLSEALASISVSVGVPSGDLELEQITRDSVIAALAAYGARPDKRAGTKKESSGASVAS